MTPEMEKECKARSEIIQILQENKFELMHSSYILIELYFTVLAAMNVDKESVSKLANTCIDDVYEQIRVSVQECKKMKDEEAKINS